VRIALAADHAGFALKERVKEFLKGAGHEVIDFGTDSEQSCDYPDFGIKAAEAVARGEAERGILICGTGIGMCISANKVRGVYAALCHDLFTTERSRTHNNANVLCMGALVVEEKLALRMVDLWLKTPFEGGRHERRVGKIAEYEKTSLG